MRKNDFYALIETLRGVNAAKFHRVLDRMYDARRAHELSMNLLREIFQKHLRVLPHGCAHGRERRIAQHLRRLDRDVDRVDASDLRHWTELTTQKSDARFASMRYASGK